MLKGFGAFIAGLLMGAAKAEMKQDEPKMQEADDIIDEGWDYNKWVTPLDSYRDFGHTWACASWYARIHTRAPTVDDWPVVSGVTIMWFAENPIPEGWVESGKNGTPRVLNYIIGGIDMVQEPDVIFITKV
jgi:hypothetical protein